MCCARFVSVGRKDVINIVARLSNLRLRAVRLALGRSPSRFSPRLASLSLSVSRSATLPWGWLSSPRFEPLSRAENPLRCGITSSLGELTFGIRVRQHFRRDNNRSDRPIAWLSTARWTRQSLETSCSVVALFDYDRR